MREDTELRKIFNRLSTNNRVIDFKSPVKIGADLQKYLNYYAFNQNDIDFYFGKIEVNDTEIIVQTFAPKYSKGTVVLLHGYLDHVGNLKHIINYLNKHQYTVVSYDLQGHGLSAGEVASIKQFADYVSTLELLMEKVKRELSGPFYAIGHSTGGAILTNYVLKNKDHSFERVILVAPVIRSRFWYLIKIGMGLVKAFPFISRVKRQFRKNSSNQDYLDWVRMDPLQPEKVALNWTQALIDWNKKIQMYSPVHTKTCIIQGTEDDTVDWKFNIGFITKKFLDSKVVYIEKGRHALFNEAETKREQVFTFIRQFLK